MLLATVGVVLLAAKVQVIGGGAACQLTLTDAERELEALLAVTL